MHHCGKAHGFSYVPSHDNQKRLLMDLSGQGWGHMATFFAPSAQDFKAHKPKGVFLHSSLKPV